MGEDRAPAATGTDARQERTADVALPVGHQVTIPGHFDMPVTLEGARRLTTGFGIRVRLPDGTLDETALGAEEASTLAGIAPSAEGKVPLIDAERLRLLIESTRIRLAYTHDRQFAVGLSGIRRIELKGHKRGQTIRLTTNEWNKEPGKIPQFASPCIL